jgi:anti-sigma B factor antagonist
MKPPPAIDILTGELDLQASRALGQRLSEQVGGGVQAGDLILDLSTVSFMDSSALGVIAQADQRLRRQGRQLALVAPEGSPARKLMAVTATDRRLRIAPTREEAQAALADDQDAA